jgi:hypothetical protein
MLSEMTQESTGSAPPPINEDNSEDSPPLVENTEAWESKATEVTNKDQVSDQTGRGEIFSDSEDIDEKFSTAFSYFHM